jgi:hypothetical protein
MTPIDHAQRIRELEFKLHKAEHGMGMPYSPEDVAHYRRLLAEAGQAARTAELRQRRLIEAAPELLRIVKTLELLLRDRTETSHLLNVAMEQARAAIAEAEGTS